MTHSAVGADVFEPLDVACDLALEVALELEPLQLLADGILLVGRKFVSLFLQINFSGGQNFGGAGGAHAVQRRQCKDRAFVWNGDAGDSHILTLALLVARVLADNIHPPFAAYEFAGRATRLDRCLHFHISIVAA